MWIWTWTCDMEVRPKRAALENRLDERDDRREALQLRIDQQLLRSVYGRSAFAAPTCAWSRRSSATPLMPRGRRSRRRFTHAARGHKCSGVQLRVGGQ